MPGGSIGTEELFRRHAQFVARFAVRLGVQSQDVDDIVQEVFIVAHRNGGYVEGPARPTTWLAKITFGVVSSRKRTQRRRAEYIVDAV
jgi:RNA polymerase sigma-70 factor (ECF subfamily)